MSRGLLALLLILAVLVFFYAATGQEVQSHEVTLVFGIILGILIGWWTGGTRVLRKIRKQEHRKVDDTYDQRQELL